MSYKFVLDFGIAEYDSAVAEMEKQDDRGLSIVAASLCEAMLVKAIDSRLTHNDPKIYGQFMKGYGPLGSFRARIDLGFFLGLYTKETHRRLMRVKEIRNLMAHTIKPLSFSTQDIRDQMQHLPDISSIIVPWRKQKLALADKALRSNLDPEKNRRVIEVVDEIVTTFEAMREKGDRLKFMAYIQNRTVSFILAEAAGLNARAPAAYLIHL